MPQKMQREFKTAYHFAQFKLDDEGLERYGARVPLAKRLIKLLRQLLEAKGRVVGYNEIAWHIWKREDVPTHSLTRAIYLMRQVIGEWDGDYIIKTHRGAGLWITVPVKKVVEKHYNDRSGSSGNDVSTAAMVRTALEIAGDRKDESLQLASSVLGKMAEKTDAKAVAFALKADVEIARLIRGNARPVDQIPLINELLAAALTAEPNLIAAKATKAWVVGLLEGQPAAGLSMIQDTIAVQPQQWLSLAYLIWLHISTYDLESARDVVETGLLVNPTERNFITLKGWILCAQRRYEEAAFYLDEMIEVRPDIDLLWILRAVASVKMKHYAHAINLIDHVVGLYPDESFVLSSQVWTYAAAGYREEALAMLTRLTNKGRYILPTVLAGIRLVMGDEIGSENALQQARKVRCPWFAVAWCDPRLRID